MFDYRTYQAAIDEVMQRKIFFLVGALKSGTTWLQRLLHSHPDICCMGESHIGDEIAPKIEALCDQHNRLIEGKNLMLYGSDGGYPLLTQGHVRYLIHALLCMLLHRQTNSGTFACIGEKTPNHVQTLALLSQLIPHAKVIHIIRDGRDCAVSGWYHFRRVNQRNLDVVEETYPRLAIYVEQFVQRWVQDVPKGQAFGHQHPDRYIEIRYEHLHERPEAELRGILQFLDLSASAGMIAECVSQGSFESLSGGRTPGEHDPNSHYRKGIVGDWRNHFDQECHRVFNHYGADLLVRLGYAAS